uniref:nicotinamidase n=1 Tax=Heterorhabditis bacteriophora TaxID=37862 RepID=A0A1I7WMB6_HETBA
MGPDTELSERGRIHQEIRRLIGATVKDDEIDEVLDKFSKDRNGFLSTSEADFVRRTVINPLSNFKVALVVVDYQNDFVSGSLSIKVLFKVQQLKHYKRGSRKCAILFQDWHPSNHISFYEHSRNSDRKLHSEDKVRKLRPFDIVRFEIPDTIQVLYPAHCVQGSWGAELHPQLVLAEGAKYIKKGTDVMVDSYSAFRDNDGEKKSELEDFLRSKGVSVVLACGLAYDICVMHTLKDANNLGFLSAIVTDCSKGISSEKIAEAQRFFIQKGVALLEMKEAREVIRRNSVPFEWVRWLALNAK